MMDKRLSDIQSETDTHVRKARIAEENTKMILDQKLKQMDKD